jgi:hypothetical protein
MTVSTTISTVSYTGNGVTTDYAIPFPSLQEADIYVLVNDIVQTIGVDYVFVGDVTLPGATISFTVAPGDTLPIFIQRLTGLQQNTEYTTQGEYKAKQHEADFDKAMYIAQENRDLASGAGGALPIGLFQTSISIINANSGMFGNAVISHDGNVFGGAGFRFDLPDNGTVDSWSVSLFDDSGNQRDMTFDGSGTWNVPGILWLTHQTQPWGQAVLEYTTTVATGPWGRHHFINTGDLTGIGSAWSFEYVDVNNAPQFLTLDPVTGNATVGKDPLSTETNALATVAYVNAAVGAHAKGAIASDGAGAQDITNTKDVTSVTINGNGFRVVMDNPLPVARQVITLGVNGAGGLVQTSCHYTKVNDTTFDIFVTADDVPVTSNVVDLSFRVEDALL